MARLDAAIPTGPLIGQNGMVTPAWLAFFISLYMRTGGSIGQPSDNTGLEKDLAAETEARIAEDNALGASLLSEQEARQVADANLQEGLTLEAQTRLAADALAVPAALLGSMWAALDLKDILPTTDPGGGRPWNNNGTMMVGQNAGHEDHISAENGTNWWIHEDGILSWLWG